MRLASKCLPRLSSKSTVSPLLLHIIPLSLGLYSTEAVYGTLMRLVSTPTRQTQAALPTLLPAAHVEPEPRHPSHEDGCTWTPSTCTRTSSSRTTTLTPANCLQVSGAHSISDTGGSPSERGAGLS